VPPARRRTGPIHLLCDLKQAACRSRGGGILDAFSANDSTSHLAAILHIDILKNTNRGINLLYMM
jgi:hypothetical protein